MKRGLQPSQILHPHIKNHKINWIIGSQTAAFLLPLPRVSVVGEGLKGHTSLGDKLLGDQICVCLCVVMTIAMLQMGRSAWSFFCVCKMVYVLVVTKPLRKAVLPSRHAVISRSAGTIVPSLLLFFWSLQHAIIQECLSSSDRGGEHCH